MSKLKTLLIRTPHNDDVDLKDLDTILIEDKMWSPEFRLETLARRKLIAYSCFVRHLWSE